MSGGEVLLAVTDILGALEPLAADGRGDAPWGPSDAAKLYERVLERVADSEGRRGGEFHTPRSVIRVMVGLANPTANERIHDPCCGTGGMLTGAIAYVRDAVPVDAPQPRVSGASLNERGQRLTLMNLVLHGVPADIQGDAAAAVRRGPGEDEPADVVITNPPFNLSLTETGIPVSLWLLRRDVSMSNGVLLIDASEVGEMWSRSERTLGDGDVEKITSTYHRWREGRFEDEPGFARHVDLLEIRAHGHSLSPRAYLRSAPVPADGVSLGGDVRRLRDDLARLQARAVDIDAALERLLRGER